MSRISCAVLLVVAMAGCSQATPTGPAPSGLDVGPPLAPYEAIELGLLPGMRRAEATDINGRGQVVGWSEDGLNAARAFLWEDGVLRDLGSLGGGWSYAQDINDYGQVVGLSRTADRRYHAFLWTDGVMYDLEPSSAVQDNLIPLGLIHVNNAGHVAFTGIINWGPRWERRAYLWRDGVTTDLGTLGGTLTSSHARGINEHDQVVGSATPPTFADGHAFTWDQGTLTDLGTLGDTGSSRPVDINDRGQVVGASNGRAVLWESGGITDLGSLPGDNLGGAVAINEAGQVAGNSLFDPYKAGHGFRWQLGVGLPLSPTFLTDSLQLVFAMNENGFAAGDWRPSSGFGSRAVAWEGGVTWTLGPADQYTHASAVNNVGDVVGFVWLDPYGVSSQRAVLWRRIPAVATTPTSSR